MVISFVRVVYAKEQNGSQRKQKYCNQFSVNMKKLLQKPTEPKRGENCDKPANQYLGDSVEKEPKFCVADITEDVFPLKLLNDF